MLKMLRRLRHRESSKTADFDNQASSVSVISQSALEPVLILETAIENLQADQDKKMLTSDCHLIVTSHLFISSGFPDSRCDIYLSQNDALPSELCIFTTPNFKYEPFCDDFGPMNMLSVTKFIMALDQEIKHKKSSTIVYRVEPGARNLTNAAFLLGAYMVLKLHRTPDYVADCFSALESNFEGYRDATFSPPQFQLRLIDCWRGLYRAKILHWIATPSCDRPSLWGQVDMEEYELYDDYLNADLQVVVPGRLVAFRGPKHIPRQDYRDNFMEKQFVSRDFTPHYYSEMFHAMGVSTVVRLNEVCYPRSEFTSQGIRHYDLFFQDCTPPPPSVVAKFFDILDRADGMVAVHCLAGLGRTGTLIALSLIRSDGFSAREAIGWLRVMRPGSVIGEQQDFLCAVESALRQRRGASCLRRTSCLTPHDQDDVASNDASARPRRHVRFQTTAKRCSMRPDLPSPHASSAADEREHQEPSATHRDTTQLHRTPSDPSPTPVEPPVSHIRSGRMLSYPGTLDTSKDSAAAAPPPRQPATCKGNRDFAARNAVAAGKGSAGAASAVPALAATAEGRASGHSLPALAENGLPNRAVLAARHSPRPAAVAAGAAFGAGGEVQCHAAGSGCESAVSSRGGGGGSSSPAALAAQVSAACAMRGAVRVSRLHGEALAAVAVGGGGGGLRC